jgi:multicomponent Na+:H+ antiporter subunit E
MMLSVNLLIMLGWAAASGDFSSGGLAAGFLVGFVALWLARGLFGSTRYHVRAVAGVALAATFLRELGTSSLQVAAAVLNPFARPEGRFIRVPLRARSDVEIMLTANLISLTPGTLTVDVAEDRSALVVHAMTADDPAAAAQAMKSSLERAVLEALR